MKSLLKDLQSEETAKELLDKGLIEGESPNYQISLGVAKMTHQLPEYTRVSGLERSKLKQMTMQFIQNAGEDGTMRDGIYEYLKVAMPSNKTKEQNLRLLGKILKELKEEGAVSLKGLSWYEVQNPTKKNYNGLEMTDYNQLRQFSQNLSARA